MRGLVIAPLLALALLQVPDAAYCQFRVPGQQPAQPTGQPPVQSPAAQPQPQAETPQKESSVEMKDGKLSVDLKDAELGTVMNQIGAKMNAPVQVNGAVFSRKVTTKFSGLEIERGIGRLLALAKESNYVLRYNETGALSGIELYADNSAPSPGQQPGSLVQPGLTPPGNPFLRRYRRFTPPQPAPNMTAQQQQPPAAPAAQYSRPSAEPITGQQQPSAGRAAPAPQPSRQSPAQAQLPQTSNSGFLSNPAQQVPKPAGAGGWGGSHTY